MHIRRSLPFLVSLAALYGLTLFRLANSYWALGSPHVLAFVAAEGYWWVVVPVRWGVCVILEDGDEDEGEDDDDEEEEDWERTVWKLGVAVIRRVKGHSGDGDIL
ncbi:hypothetical protein DFH27DRAFT_579180 [Peziza echinospora]|nr:hypothetical protein DFH27DRAFT_579180 [Peziza echinospora]